MALRHFMDLLGHEFEIKDLGTLHYVGIKARHTTIDLHLSQTKYVLDLLIGTHMTDCKPCSTSIASRAQLSNQDCTPFSNPTEFCHLLSSLQYLTLIRPNIAYVVNHVSQFMSRPTQTHFIAAKRILKYVKGTLDHGISFRRSSDPSLHYGYSDADWAGCPDTRRSPLGFLIFHGPNLVSWSLTKQPTVSWSSTEFDTQFWLMLMPNLFGVLMCFVSLDFRFLPPPFYIVII